MLLDYIFRIKVNGEVIYVRDDYKDICVQNEDKAENNTQNSIKTSEKNSNKK